VRWSVEPSKGEVDRGRLGGAHYSWEGPTKQLNCFPKVSM
jgi:hypothetical protein